MYFPCIAWLGDCLGTRVETPSLLLWRILPYVLCRCQYASLSQYQCYQDYQHTSRHVPTHRVRINEQTLCVTTVESGAPRSLHCISHLWFRWHRSCFRDERTKSHCVCLPPQCHVRTVSACAVVLRRTRPDWETSVIVCFV